MNLRDAIFQRRAVRSYQAREVTARIVDELLAAAVQAPSALNQQPWVFGVFHGRDRLHRYSERAKAHLLHTLHPQWEVHMRGELYANPAYDIFHGADTLIVVYASHQPLNPTEDCCLAAQNLMLAACDLGLGTCPVGFARSWLDLTATKRELDVPEHYIAVFPLVVGYPAHQPKPAPRRPPEIVSWKWDDAQPAPGVHDERPDAAGRGR